MNKGAAHRQHRTEIIAFFALAFGLSWLIQVPLALQAQGVIATQLPLRLHYLSAFGPLLAAFLITLWSAGARGLLRFVSGLHSWRVGIGWWAVALSPLLAIALLNLGIILIRGDPIGLQELGRIDYMPNLGVGAALFWFATFGLGEETGWRGFALPRLQTGRNALLASLILWAAWALWHLPMFFYMYPVSILPGWLVGILAGTITFTWLFNSTHGSVLLTAIFHGLFNFTTACYVCKTGLAGAVISSLVMVWAVLVVLVFKPAALSAKEKMTVGAKLAAKGSIPSA